ncbi:hypothetical protein OG455_39230 [Kitasatospora sp. NBC_01287]|uniref:hypothetical protein n=1 Tax=Kitasatospora sp. NBC_01287 TaxID=2903573 RepID=UPI002256444A|nr:hypothetical protein [Kitasatospora sp. NBC_01287]MCX4751470.1 hypothetical protein [Kitasatospora sp. NBC_01287]
MPTPRAPWIPGGGTALDWGLRIPCPVGVGPAGLSGEGGAVWCLDCGDRYTGRPAQVGDDHPHRDDAHHAARLHADDHEADFRRFVHAERTREARENSGWTGSVYALVAAATGEDPDSGVWWDGNGYRLVPHGARIDAKGRRVRRRVVELIIKAGFLRQEEDGDVVATADGRAMLTIWRHHRAELAEPWPARAEPEALPPLPGGKEAQRRREAARQRALELERQAAQSRAEFLRRREEAERQHQADQAAKRQRQADEQAERERAERARTGADIYLTWSAVSAARWSVTGTGNDRRLDVVLNTTDFASDMYEIRENGHFVSRHPYRHQTEPAVRQLLADGVEIGQRTPGPTPAASTEAGPGEPAVRGQQAPPPPPFVTPVYGPRSVEQRGEPGFPLTHPATCALAGRRVAELAVRQKRKRLTGRSCTRQDEPTGCATTQNQSPREHRGASTVHRDHLQHARG